MKDSKLKISIRAERERETGVFTVRRTKQTIFVIQGIQVKLKVDTPEKSFLNWLFHSPHMPFPHINFEF